MDRISRAQIDSYKGIARSTRNKQIGHFNRWKRFLSKCSIKDPFLTQYKPVEKGQIICAFSNTVRNNELGTTTKPSLRATTVNATITDVASTFRENFLDDPTLDDKGKRWMVLQRQLRGYEDSDPIKKRQACIPLIVFKTLLQKARTPNEIAISELTSGALFFAMRSCEYTHTSGDPFSGERKTKLLRVRNVRFFNNTEELSRRQIDLSSKASLVQITFEFQKNRQKFQSISMHAVDEPFCPVKLWAKIIQRILSYPKGSTNSPVNLVRSNRHYSYITSQQIRTSLRSTIKLLGENKLGIKSESVGTHSIRSTFAMILLLDKVRFTIIKKLGRWLSDAVVCYIRENVLDFSKGVSKAFAKKQPIESFYNASSFVKSIKSQYGDDSD